MMSDTSSTYRGWYQYMDEHNLHGASPEVLATAKKAYRAEYKRKWRKNHRKEYQEIQISFSKDEVARIKATAKEHHMTLTEFVREAVQSYFDRHYIVPNTNRVAQYEVILAEAITAIRQIATSKEQDLFNREAKYRALETAIQSLKSQTDELFRKPKLLEEMVKELAATRPELHHHLIRMIQLVS